MKKTRAQFRWLLSTLRDHCKDKEASDLSFGMVEREFSKAEKFFADRNTYIKLSDYIFNTKTKDPIETLQQNGYFLRGDKQILNKTYFDESAIIHLIECFMWANLDRKMPRHLIAKKIGRIKVLTCTDPEQTLCVWINHCVQPYAKKLPPLSTISQHFIGLPHFRALLYYYTKDETLLRFADSATNAQIALKTCVKLGITPPFDQFNYKQSPLVIMCFLMDAISVLDKVKPIPPPRPISKLDIQRLNYNIISTRKEVESIKKRVILLTNDVATINSKLMKMRRPASAFAATQQPRDLDSLNLDFNSQAAKTSELPPLSSTGSDRPKSALRVRWDIPPDVMPHDPNRDHESHSDENENEGHEHQPHENEPPLGSPHHNENEHQHDPQEAEAPQ